MKKKIHLIWQYDFCWEYDWLCWLLSDFEIRHILDERNEVCLENSIVVPHVVNTVRKNFPRFNEYMKKFKDKRLKVGCIHLGDEAGESSVSFYQDADFIFRNYWHDTVEKLKNCYYFALGYKPGVYNELSPKNIRKRKYLLSFAGSLKGKWHTSRNTMFRCAKQIPGNKYFYITGQFHNPEALTARAYGDLLCNTIFALCPRGNNSVDTFRLYEAMEAGAIPIVEDDKISYWRKAYGPGFPCPRIDNWENLKTLLPEIDIEQTAKKIQDWWLQYKQSLHKLVTGTIENTFFKTCCKQS